MATITLTEINGSDNIAGSRITINDNFKKAANALNTLETYLDSSFTPGAALNVGSLLVKKYTRPITDQIFTVEATGLIGGNLNIGQDLGVTRDAVVSRNATIHGNLTLDGTVGTSSKFTSSVPMSQDAANINPQFSLGNSSNYLAINPQTLTSPSSTSTARNIVPTVNFNKVNVIRLDWSTYTGTLTTNCDTIVLPVVTDPFVAAGQIITILIDAPAPALTSVSFAISISTLDSCYTSVLFNTLPGDADSIAMRQTAITLIADANGWRILHTVGLASIA